MSTFEGYDKGVLLRGLAKDQLGIDPNVRSLRRMIASVASNFLPDPPILQVEETALDNFRQQFVLEITKRILLLCIESPMRSRPPNLLFLATPTVFYPPDLTQP